MAMHIQLVCRPKVAQSWQAPLQASPRGFRISNAFQALAQAEASLRDVPPDVAVVEVTSAQDFDRVQAIAQDLPDLDWVLVGLQPDADALLALMRAGVREVLPGEPDGVSLAQAVERLARKRGGAARPVRRAKVLCFMSCKGGSGATFLAANLAEALSDGGARKVALLDFNLQFGDALLFISSQRAPSHVAEVAANSDRLDGELLRASMLEVSPGLHVLPAPEDPALAAEVGAEHVRAILQTAQADFDYVVVDIGRTLSAVALQALDMADQVYAVLQLTLPFIRDGKRLREVFTSLDYPPTKISWVVNRFEKGGQLTLDDLKKSLKTQQLITVPNHYAVVADSVNQGVPVAKVAPRSPVTQALAEMADHIAHPGIADAAGSAGLKGLLSKVFDRRTSKVTA